MFLTVVLHLQVSSHQISGARKEIPENEASEGNGGLTCTRPCRWCVCVCERACSDRQQVDVLSRLTLEELQQLVTSPPVLDEGLFSSLSGLSEVCVAAYMLCVTLFSVFTFGSYC